MKQFDRWGLWRAGKTWALIRFLQQHTELNDLYWTFESTVGNAEKTVAVSGFDPATALAFKGEARRIPATPPKWRKHFRDFGNWVRLAGVVSMASYLETYMASVITSSLDSDPGLLIGAPRSVEGVKLLKTRRRQTTLKHVESCTRGEWPARVAGYRRLFGHAPPGLLSAVGDLERLRRLRNAVGHAFGRSGSLRLIGAMPDTQPADRIGRKQLQRFFEVTETAARGIDGHLGPAHIGEYESLLYFHQSRSTLQRWNSSEARELRRAFGRFDWAGSGLVGGEFCKGLVAYYTKQ